MRVGAGAGVLWVPREKLMSVLDSEGCYWLPRDNF